MAGMPGEEALERLRRGIPLDGHRTRPADVTLLSRRGGEKDGLLRVIIREGRNRQVRRMCDAVGHPVQSLKRTRIGPLGDARLKPGMWRDLTSDEVRGLKRWTGESRPKAVDRPKPTPKTGRRPGS